MSVCNLNKDEFEDCFVKPLDYLMCPVKEPENWLFWAILVFYRDFMVFCGILGLADNKYNLNAKRASYKIQKSSHNQRLIR